MKFASTDQYLIINVFLITTCRLESYWTEFRWDACPLYWSQNCVSIFIVKIEHWIFVNKLLVICCAMDSKNKSTDRATIENHITENCARSYLYFSIKHNNISYIYIKATNMHSSIDKNLFSYRKKMSELIINNIKYLIHIQ